jgi:F0F1-type ATP synthase membrane subunit a
VNNEIHVSLTPETINLFGLKIQNSQFTTIVVMVLLAILVISALGRAKVVPGRWQAFWEVPLEFMLNTIEDGVGRNKLARRLFPLVATLFIFILFANWFALIPGVGTIGHEEYKLKAEAGGQVKAGGYALASANIPVYSQANTSSPVVKPVAATKAGEGAQPGGAKQESANTGGSETVAQAETYAYKVTAISGNFAQVERIAEIGFMADPKYWTGGTSGTPVAYKDDNALKGYVQTNQLQSAKLGYLVIPIIRPPNADLNMTLAMALVAVIVANFVAIISHGVGGWVSEFFPTRGPLDILLTPIEIIGQLSRVLSLSFRLFGNIFAGESLLAVILTIASPALVIFLALEMFFGFLQALVFASLTTVYLGLAVAGHGEGHGEEHEHAEEHGHGHGEKAPPKELVRAAGD